MDHLQSTQLDLAGLLEESEHASGALLLFVGTVRENNDGRPVTGMSYTAHESMAERLLADIESETCARFDICSCRILHRLGALALGDASVVIAVRSAHRAAAFEASRYAIEELKKRAPIWKQEHYSDGDSAYLEGTPLKPS